MDAAKEPYAGDRICNCKHSDADYEAAISRAENHEQFASYFENTVGIFREALETIVGPADSGRFIGVYRKAGGGYAGLQAIARAALGE